MQAPTSRTRGRSGLPAALAAVVLLLMSATCDGGGRAQPSEPEATTAGPTAPTVTCGAAAPDGSGGVEVSETGFSMVRNSGGDLLVSYGVVLENTSSTHLAIQTQAVVRLTDADGNQVNDIIQDPPGDPLWEIQTVFPGQRIGFGDDARIDRESVEGLDVEIGESLWMPIDQLRDVAEVTATDITIDQNDTGTAATIRFEIAGGYTMGNSPVSREAIRSAESHAIFRDVDGNVVGGAGKAGDNWHQPGDPLLGRVGASSIPDRADRDATEIYVSPLYPPYIDPLC